MDDENAVRRPHGVSASQNPEPVLSRLQLWNDVELRSPSQHMAVDRALLEGATFPILRIYRWSGPCVTIGYFQDLEATLTANPNLEVVRRWTGGGTVLHGLDAPYSLIVPRNELFAARRPADSYALIHSRLAFALRDALPDLVCAPHDAPKYSAACFENPVKGDLILGSRKIAGAAQRRTRQGLLHQGSVHLSSPDFPQALTFARALSATVETFLPQL